MPARRADRQSASTLMVVWLSGQYPRGTFAPGGVGGVACQRTSPVGVIRAALKPCITPRLGPDVLLAGQPRLVAKLHRSWPGGVVSPARANSSLVPRDAETTALTPTTPAVRMWTRPSDRAASCGACGQGMDKCCALAHPLPTLAALAPTSSPLLQQRLMGKATAPTGSRIAPSSQAIRLRNKPANSHGGSTRKCEKQHQVTVTSVRIFKPADLIHLHPVGSSFTGTPSTRRIGARCGRSVPTSTPTPSNRRFRTGRRWRWWKAWIFGFSAREALRYAQERRSGLEVFLDDPEVAIDTNHLERALRPIPLGKRNWLFTSSEVGAQRVGIIRSLLVTCRLHEVDACTCLVDVLQCVSVHPANHAIELTPRMWKSRFADAPLRSDLGAHHHDPPSH